MKVSEVMDKTGLTKRAIRYYEEEGLISPFICNENGYRDYSADDVERLVKISLFRQIDLSINNIKVLIDDPSQFNHILQGHLKRIEENINRLKTSKELINEIVGNNSISDSEEFIKKLKELRDCIDNDNKTKPGYIEKQLERIFPGVYGRMICIHFSSFLNEAIDSREKEEAWNEIVKYFDETDSVRYTEEFENVYSNFSEEDLEKMSQSINDRIRKLINSSDEELENYKNEIIESIKKIQSNDEFREYRSKLQRMNMPVKEQITASGYYDRFTKNMRILSRDYDKYMRVMEKMNDELGLRYDDNGNIVSDMFFLD